MTDSEKIDLLLAEMQGMKSEMQDMKSEMQDMKSEMQDMKSEMQDMKSEMQDMKSEMQDMKSEMQDMKSEMQDMKSEMQDMKSEMQDMKSDMQELNRRTTSIELHIENVTDKNIQLIAENFVELTKKLNQAIPVADKNLAYEVKVNYLTCEMERLKKEIDEIKSRIA